MRQRKLKPAWREKAFEDFAADFGAEFAIRSCKTTYADAQTHAMWCMWREGRQAARRAALEEAVQACEREHLEEPQAGTEDIAYDNAVRDCADAIRALAAQTGQEGK